MKKLFIVLFVGISLSVPHISYGGPGIVKKAVWACKKVLGCQSLSREKLLQPQQLEKTLIKRVRQTHNKIYNNIGLAQMGEILFAGEYPVLFSDSWSPELKQVFLHDKPWLLAAGEQAQRSYFIAWHNRLVATVIKERKELKKAIQQNINRLQKERVPVTQAPLAMQAADLIPPNTKQILIGEQHQIKGVSQEILSFIKNVQAQNPRRQIIYLTEFLLQDIDPLYTLSIMQLYIKDQPYYDIFFWLSTHNICMMGLEPHYVWGMNSPRLYLGHLFQPKPFPVPLWESVSGVYLRNQSWRGAIAAARKKYPDALFIIHAGYGHTDYTSPFSIAGMFNPQETFVLRVVQEEESLFHTFSEGKLAGFSLLGWKDKQLALLAGCDAQIKVP